MIVLIILISKLLYWFGKLFGKGSNLPGKIALKMDKNLLKKVALPNNIIMITGSNGKTSTTEMIYKVLSNSGFKVGCNLEGSNQIEGITTMILKNANLLGKVNKDILVIESDERYFRHVLKFLKPKYLVVTNLYRDQMTRNGHPELIYDIINEGITQEIHLILNTDDPLSSLYGYGRKNVTYFGINENELSSKECLSVYNDGKYCPNCKSTMKYDYYHFNHIGSYHCKKCGHERKNPNYAVTDIDLKSGNIVINNKNRIKMNFHSIYNAYNILASYAVARIFGIDEEKIVSVLTEFVTQKDRVQSFELNGHECVLLTSKHENSVSYNQSLMYIVNQNEECTVVFIIDEISRKYSTNDTSWIWDIDFELLKSNCVKRIILSGKFVEDLKMRFENSTIGMDKIVIKMDLDEMMQEVKNNSIGKVYVITCFSDRMKFMNRR